MSSKITSMLYIDGKTETVLKAMQSVEKVASSDAMPRIKHPMDVQFSLGRDADSVILRTAHSILRKRIITRGSSRRWRLCTCGRG